MSLKDYTRKDIVEIRQYLVDLIEAIDTTGKWTDRNESDLGMVFVELAAGVADMLNFYIDKQALENYLPTVTQRKNLRRILALVGYRMKGPVSARCKGYIDLDKSLPYDITIPKYFQVSYMRSTGNIYYATDADYDIPAGAKTVNVTFVQGIVNTINLTVADLLENRKITIRDNSVATGSIELTVGDVVWTEVPDVLVDEKYGTKFSVMEDENDYPCIEFCYAWKDFLPADYRTSVKIRYLRTAGSKGAISKNLLDKIEQDLIYSVDGVQTNLRSHLSVKNTEDASGGADRETMDEARLKAPQLVKSRNLMTTLEDYETFAENEPGVYRACAIDWNIENGKYVGVPYKVNVHIMPTDEEIYVATEALLEKVKAGMQKLLWTSINLTLLPAIIEDIDVVVEVFTSSDQRNWPGLKREVEDIYRDFFRKTNCEFGQTFTLGQLETIVKNNSEMAEIVNILEPSSIVRLEPNEFPKLNKLDVYVRNIAYYGEDEETKDDTASSDNEGEGESE